ncbi:MAG: hypothetical protein H6Q72_3715 [Firmicutes bacterium]|nr:hypothetical protein [Bacillota bacterium]
MKKKGVFGKLLGAVLLMMIGMSAVPSSALAYQMDIRNPYTDKMHLAVVDYDDVAGRWRCHGWWEVQALSTRRINVDSSVSKNIIYLFVKTSEATWSGEGIPSSITRTVNGNKFSYYDGQPCPEGPRMRTEFFVKYELEDGFLYWSPE